MTADELLRGGYAAAFEHVLKALDRLDARLTALEASTAIQYGTMGGIERQEDEPVVVLEFKSNTPR